MEISITTLSENTANHEFLAEWGLSILVDVDGTRILFDTGRSFSVVHNAQILGVDLATIDKIVLSHGHRDHTGGLVEVLRRCRKEVEVIAHPDVWAPKYSRLEKEEVYSGMPFMRDYLENLGARFTMERNPVHINKCIMTSGEIPMKTSYEKVDDYIHVKENGVFKPDKLADDLALVIDADFGLVVILGCAHRGMVNTLRHAQKITGKEKVYAVIGGTHLYRADTERLEGTVADLKQMGVERIGVSHCTGFAPSSRLSTEFGENFFLNNAGTRLTLP